MTVIGQRAKTVNYRDKKEMLQAVYSIYAGWVEPFSLACGKGCASCCTASVSISSLEGEAILDFVGQTGRENWLHDRLNQRRPRKGRAGMTMNRFAAACLNRQEVETEDDDCWDFSPCIFLDDSCCSIYAVRPFGCRSFGSLVRCAPDRPAAITPDHLTVNTVFTQVIEHLSSDGGSWSTMTVMLRNLTGLDVPGENMQLMPALPVPGFLLEAREVMVIRPLLQELCRRFPAQGIFCDLIDNFLPIE